MGEDERDIVQRTGEKKTIFTELVLVVSNFHFNKRAQTLHQDLKCTPLDCYISLKFSSTKFKPAPGGAVKPDDDAESTSTPTDPDGGNDVSGATASRYFFDGRYVFLSYQAFASLVTDPYLASTFWPKVKSNFEKATGLPLELNDLLEIFFEDDDDDVVGPAPQKNVNANADADADDDDDDDDDVEEGEKKGVSKRTAKTAVKKKAAQRLESSDNDDNDDVERTEGRGVKKSPAKSAKKSAAAQKKSKK